MDKKLKILHLEDYASDAMLVRRALQKGNLDFEKLVVDTKAGFVKALKDFSPDIILSDHSLPSFNSHDALTILQEMGMKIPFILITANISEEFAVDVIKRGADDYILKDRLQRLPNAIHNALEKFRLEKERQHFLDDLIKKEKHYRALIENINDAIILIDENKELAYQSPSAKRLTGYGFDEMKDKSIFDFLHPEDLQKAQLIFEKVSEQSGVAFTSQYRVRHKNGHYLWMEGTIINLLHDESVKSYIINYRNISERKNAEELLERSNQLARIGNWQLDRLNQTVYWSPIARSIHEVNNDFIPNPETALAFFKEGPNRESVRNAFRLAIEKGISWDIEQEIVTAKSNERWIRIIGEPEFIDGKCIKLYGSIQDIDLNKRNEIKFQKIYEEKNSILESIGDAFFALDKNWIVTYWNKEAERLLDRGKEEIVGNDLWFSFPDRIDSESFRNYHIAMEKGQAVHFEDSVPSGKWFEISAYPTGNGLSVYFKDITNRRQEQMHLLQLNEDLKKSAKDLAVSNSELEQFAYVASHDLQEPLRMVTSFLSQIEKKYTPQLDDKGREYIHFAVDGAKRMRQIILDLLEFSRVGRLEDKLELVETNTLISDIMSLHQKKIEETGSIITFDHLPAVQTHKTPFRQVLQNLISNALKYQEKGRPSIIEISYQENDGYWQFSVKDNGISIEEEYFEKIFVIFQRLHNKDEYSGTGMGLAICKKIVENLGGKIWVNSVPNQGSTFFFTIPKNHDALNKSLLK
ncbi:MAG: PAS domain S-box protein [Flavitalea sp.]